MWGVYEQMSFGREREKLNLDVLLPQNILVIYKMKLWSLSSLDLSRLAVLENNTELTIFCDVGIER